MMTKHKISSHRKSSPYYGRGLSRGRTHFHGLGEFDVCKFIAELVLDVPEEEDTITLKDFLTNFRLLKSCKMRRESDLEITKKLKQSCCHRRTNEIRVWRHQNFTWILMSDVINGSKPFSPSVLPRPGKAQTFILSKGKNLSFSII